MESAEGFVITNRLQSVRDLLFACLRQLCVPGRTSHSMKALTAKFSVSLAFSVVKASQTNAKSKTQPIRLGSDAILCGSYVVAVPSPSGGAAAGAGGCCSA